MKDASAASGSADPKAKSAKAGAASDVGERKRFEVKKVWGE